MSTRNQISTHPINKHGKEKEYFVLRTVGRNTGVQAPGALQGGEEFVHKHQDTQQFHICESFFKGRNCHLKNGMPMTTLFVMVKMTTPLPVWHLENGQVDSDRSTGCQARQPCECVPRELSCVGVNILLSEKGN